MSTALLAAIIIIINSSHFLNEWSVYFKRDTCDDESVNCSDISLCFRNKRARRRSNTKIRFLYYMKTIFRRTNRLPIKYCCVRVLAVNENIPHFRKIVSVRCVFFFLRQFYSFYFNQIFVRRIKICRFRYRHTL